MPTSITAGELNGLMQSEAELGLIDVREYGEYNTSHIPGFSSLPRRLLEFRAEELAPYKGVHLVVCDDDGRRADLAAATLEVMGYGRVSVLAGGANRWAYEGYPTEWGTNVLSKDFGERIQVERSVPEIDAEELEQRISNAEVEVVVDTRTPQEHTSYCIPGSRSLPGGELALHIWDLVDDLETPVVVHCAGRTRSIIGTGLLQRMGFKNARGLRNGTMGWSLAGLDLEVGSQRTEAPKVSEGARSKAEAFARKAAAEDGVQVLGIDALQDLMSRSNNETVYLIDVRTVEEFRDGYVPGFRWYPGGQAVQQSDDVVAVKNGNIVFCCDGSIRSFVTASWFRQMGYPKVYCVEGGTSAWRDAGLQLQSGMAPHEPFGLDEEMDKVKSIDAHELQDRLLSSSPPSVLFVGTSQEYAEGHVAGARWMPRGWLELWIGDLGVDKSSELVVTCSDGRNSVLAAATLKELGYSNVMVMNGGMKRWLGEGLSVEKGLTGVMSPPDDMVAFGSERNFAEAINYLRWEEELGRKYEPAPER